MDNLGRRALVFGLAALPFYAKSPLMVLSQSEANSVEALMDRIIPADEDAGAKEAGVLYYLDKQLAGPLSRFVSVYRKGLPALEASFASTHKNSVANANLGELTSWLGELEKSGPPEAKTFFRILVEHTMQGYYGGPENGGNRDEASWRMLHVNSVLGGHSH